jgi:hypothetical protein
MPHTESERWQASKPGISIRPSAGASSRCSFVLHRVLHSGVEIPSRPHNINWCKYIHLPEINVLWSTGCCLVSNLHTALPQPKQSDISLPVAQRGGQPRPRPAPSCAQIVAECLAAAEVERKTDADANMYANSLHSAGVSRMPVPKCLSTQGWMGWVVQRLMQLRTILHAFHNMSLTSRSFYCTIRTCHKIYKMH